MEKSLNKLIIHRNIVAINVQNICTNILMILRNIKINLAKIVVKTMTIHMVVEDSVVKNVNLSI